MPTQPLPAEESKTPSVQRVIAVMWPSFLAAVAATVVFFTLFDPVELALLLGVPGFSSLGGYTLGFFFFWIVTAVASWLTVYFARPCHREKSAGIDGN